MAVMDEVPQLQHRDVGEGLMEAIASHAEFMTDFYTFSSYEEEALSSFSL